MSKPVTNPKSLKASLAILLKTRQIEDIAPYAREVIENEIFRYQHMIKQQKQEQTKIYGFGRVCSNPKCEKAGELQPWDNFYKNKNSSNGHSSWCKTCSDKNSRAAAKAKRNGNGPSCFRSEGPNWTTYL